jgi:hypothetical protein
MTKYIIAIVATLALTVTAIGLYVDRPKFQPVKREAPWTIETIRCRVHQDCS